MWCGYWWVFGVDFVGGFDDCFVVGVGSYVWLFEGLGVVFVYVVCVVFDDDWFCGCVVVFGV